MKHRALLAFCLMAALASAAPAQPQPDLGSEEQRQAGKAVYDKWCAQCHGDDGAGEGIAAPYVHPKPRDFTSAKYKIRSTRNGSLPTDADLRGVYWMQADLSGADLRGANLTGARIDGLGFARARLAGAAAPEGVTVRLLREDPAGRSADWAGIGELHRAVWDEDPTEYVAGQRAAQDADPERVSTWLAVAGDGTVVCAARVNFHAGTEFASLWGGSTLAAWRGRGIYKALVSRRADEAAERGLRFLQVDASPDSRPILERLGLRTLTTTTPWTWRP